MCSGHIWNEGCKSPNHRILRTCAWLIWNDSRKTKQSSSNSWRQLASYAHELGKITTFIQTYASWTKHEEMLTQVSNTRLMFNMIHGGDKMLLMGSTATHRNFHITGVPPLCEQCDSIGQTKRCNGVCLRDQPRVRQHYEYRWFWFDLTIAHTQSKVWVK